MQCPHCEEETDPTLAYCKFCGEQIELDEEEVQRALERDDEQTAIEHLEEKTRVALYLSVFVLVIVIAFRLVVVRKVEADVSPAYYAPARVAEDKASDPPASVELPSAPIEIPGENDKK